MEKQLRIEQQMKKQSLLELKRIERYNNDVKRWQFMEYQQSQQSNKEALRKQKYLLGL